MEIKVLPVLYYWPGESLEEFVDLKPFEGCEPYIPAARVRQVIDAIQSVASKPHHGAIARRAFDVQLQVLKQFIDDVEDDGQHR